MIFGDSSSHELLATDLWAKHHQLPSIQLPQDSPFAITVNYVMSVLDQNFSDFPGLNPQLGGIKHRVQKGSIGSVRKVELEILQAGKV